MKNKSTIILIIISLIASFTYFFDVGKNNDDFYIEANKIDIQNYNNIVKNKEIKNQNENDTTLIIDNEKETKTLININTADKETLNSLPGIGDVISNNIIEYRENISLFYKIEDIKNVKQIGDKKYEKIKHLITVN